MSPKYQLIAALLLIGGAFAGGYYLAPGKVKIETRIVKDTETRIIERPDGSKETIIKEKDRSTSTLDKSRPQGEWMFTALIPVDGVRFDLNNTIINAQKRVLGPVYAGAWATLDGSWGLSVGMRF